MAPPLCLNKCIVDIPGYDDLPDPNEWTAALTIEFIVRLILYIPISLINFLVLLTLWNTPSLRKATNLVIGSLAVTDFLVGVMGPVGLPYDLELVVLPIMCLLSNCIMLAFFSVSIFHLTFISVDKCLCICKPFLYVSLISERHVWVFIASCWTWGGLLSIASFLGVGRQRNWGGLCRTDLLYQLWFVIFLVFIHFLLPFFIMLFAYTNIFLVARRQQMAVQNLLRLAPVRVQGQDVQLNEITYSPSRHRAKLRTAKLLLLPLCYFYLCWAPWYLVTLWSVSMGKTMESKVSERFVQTLAVLNSLGNPILYAFSQPDLGKAMLVNLKTTQDKLKTCCTRCLRRKSGNLA